ncbi:DUF1365 domain-containing protein [Catenovulum sp. 2E275]|uniref:DUF1365 domain-containing protein n=1 Tax=Catenovulum sp. 2E275 TaxID=2980497 RepID=UPI0021CEC367|nr:DUF1365 domain-containing protein [Catenovulum sp. 2E275]MCU4674635.1 DUF1365 domain-containing protein [Catenovulum sp. 2E275]
MTIANPFNSAIYLGTTYHKRLKPKVHSFSYPIYFIYLDLDEITQITQQIKRFNTTKWAFASFIEADYLPEQADNTSLKQQVINKAIELGETENINKVCMLGQIRTLGLYFSPVNFYYLFQDDRLISILAQVSNTPWNERHFYLVPFKPKQSHICHKEFTVSPFNHLDMKYRWRTSLPDHKLDLHLDNLLDSDNEKIFHAGIHLKRQDLNNKNFNQLLINFPAMCVKTVTSIYWQALKLWLKGTPFYGYVINKQEFK